MDKHPVDVHVGHQLRLFRLRANLSQTELGQRVGVTFQQVQKYEKGVNRVSASKLLEFSQILAVPVQEFFDGADRATATSGKLVSSILGSRLDHEIFRLAAQLDNGIVKRRIRDLLAALAAGDDTASLEIRP